MKAKSQVAAAARRAIGLVTAIALATVGLVVVQPLVVEPPQAAAYTHNQPPISTRTQIHYVYADPTDAGGRVDISGTVRNRANSDKLTKFYRHVITGYSPTKGKPTIEITGIRDAAKSFSKSDMYTSSGGVWQFTGNTYDSTGTEYGPGGTIWPFTIVSKVNGTEVTGRWWSEALQLEQRNTVHSTAGNDPVTFTMYMLSKTGALHQVKYNYYAGWTSKLTVDNVGLMNANCEPIYRSADWNQLKGYYGNTTGTYKRAHQCITEDHVDKYRLFFQRPDATMPATAPTWNGTGEPTPIWVNPTYKAPTVSQPVYTQTAAASVNYGGTVAVKVNNQGGTLKIELDGNGDGDYVDAVDRVLYSGMVPADSTKTITWDGKDGAGTLLSRFAKVNLRGTVDGVAEIHLALDDVETLYGGLNITQLVGPTPNNTKVWWNDSYMSSKCWKYSDADDSAISTSCPSGSALATKISNGDQPGTLHKWGVSNSDIEAGYWGDERVIDTWQKDEVVYTSPVRTLQATDTPSLTVAITDGQTQVMPGQSLTYTVTGRNTHTWAPESGATLKAVLPAGVTYVSSSNSGTYNSSTRTVTWPAAALAGGASTTRTVTVTVDAGISRPSTLNTYGTITGVTSGQVGPATPSTGCTAPTCAVDTDTVPATSFTITKTDGKTKTREGEQSAYTITVTSASAVAETGVTVTDTVPPESTYVSSSSGGTHSGGVVTWSGLTFAPGETKTFTVTVKANTTLSLANYVNTTQVRVGSWTRSATDTNLVARAGITVEKEVCTTGISCSASVAPGTGGWGEVATFNEGANVPSGGVEGSNYALWRVRATNIGQNSPLTAVTISDPLVPACAQTTANLDSGASTAWKTCLQEDIKADKVVNTANVTATTEWSTQVTASDTATVNIIAKPVLSISKSDGVTSAVPGQQLTYTITARNSHAWKAETAATIKDVLPAGVTYVSSSNSGSYDAATRTVTWPATTIAAGATITRTVTVTVDSNVARPATLTNFATIAGVTAGVSGPATPTTANCTGALCAVDTDTVPAISFTISKTDGQTKVRRGETRTYTLTVKNTAAQAETGVTVTDTLPGQSTYQSASTGGTHASGVVTWANQTFAAGETKTYTVTVQASGTLTGPTFVNTARVALGSFSATATDSDIVPVDGISVEKEVCVTANGCSDTAAPLTGGWAKSVTTTEPVSVKWRVRATNIGQNSPLTGVTISDDTMSACNLNVGALADGQSSAWKSCTTTSVMSAQVVNTATAAGTTDGNTTVSATSQATLNVTAYPVLQVTKTDNVSVVVPGQQLTYTITAKNTHAWKAETAATIKDVLPAGVTYVSSSNSGTYDAATRTVTWPATAIAGNGTVTRTVTVTVDMGIARPSTLTNFATISGVTAGVSGPATPTTANCTGALCAMDTDTVPVSALTIAKSDNVTQVRPGDTVTYAITVTNGPNPENGVSIVDTLPPEVSYQGSTGDGKSGTYDPATRKVTFSGINLAPGAVLTVVVVAKVNASFPDPTTMTNYATVAATGQPHPDPALGCGERCASDTDDIVFPRMEITKEVCTTASCSAGAATGTGGWAESATFDDKAKVNWRIQVRNTGSFPIADLAIDDPLVPACTGPMDPIDPGATATLICSTPSARVGFTNTATATGRSDGKTLTVSDTAQVSIRPNPGVAIVKSANAGPVVVDGTTVTWSYTVTNVGNVTLTGVGVTDDMGVKVTCPKATLAMEESMVCTGTGVVKR